MSDTPSAFPSGNLDPTLRTPSTSDPSQTLQAEDSPSTGTLIGRYALIRILGEGGYGTVYLAEQTEPVKRQVALKVLKLGMDTKAVVSRFEGERQALALMDHPNIAKILDGGTTPRGQPYFVMEYVDGCPITVFCDTERATIQDRLEWFIQICNAIQHAHQKGIIHRDLKPSNILVARMEGRPLPKVIDFGIAKATDPRWMEGMDVTAAHQIIGTPAYMSPEQADSASPDIDTRSDVYSLGVVLYEMLVGKPPLETKELLQTGVGDLGKHLREKEPKRPSIRFAAFSAEDQNALAAARRTDPNKLRQILQGDVDWILMKCLEKDRQRRYESVSALASDLHQYLNQRPIAARPPSRTYQFKKLVARNRLAFATAAVMMLSLIGGFAFSSWQYVQKSAANRQLLAANLEQTRLRTLAEAAQARANTLRQQAQSRAYASDMNLVQRVLEQNHLGQAQDLLNRHRPDAGEPDLRGWEWRYLWQRCRSDALFSLGTNTDWVQKLEASPDGRFVAVSTRERPGFDLFSLSTRSAIGHFLPSNAVTTLSFSPDSQSLIVAHTDRSASKSRYRIGVLDLATTSWRSDWPSDQPVWLMEFSSHGSILSTMSEATQTQWNLASTNSTPLAKVPLPGVGKDRFYSGRLSPDGNFWAYGSSSGFLRAVDAHSGIDLWKVPCPDQYFTDFAFTPDSKFLITAAGYEKSDIWVYEAATGKPVATLAGHQSYVIRLSVSPDGKHLASGSADQTIRIWDTTQWSLERILRGHRLEVWQLAWVQDEKTLVSGSKDGAVLVWDATRTRSTSGHWTLPKSIAEWQITSNGNAMVTLGRNGEVAKWSGPEFRQKETLFQLESKVQTAKISQDARWVVGTISNRWIQLWDVRRRAMVQEFSLTNQDVYLWGFTHPGHLLVAVPAAKQYQLWRIPEFERVQSWPFQMDDSAGDVNREETLGVVFTGRGTSRSFDPRTGSMSTLALRVRQPGVAAFSPDGRRLALANKFGFARVWDTQSWDEIATFAGFLKGVHSLAWSSDGTRLAVASGDREAVKLWDMSSQQELVTLSGEGGMLSRCTFSPDGSVLGALDQQGTLNLWRAPNWEEIQANE